MKIPSSRLPRRLVVLSLVAALPFLLFAPASPAARPKEKRVPSAPKALETVRVSPSGATVMLGQTVQFRAYVDGAKAPSVRWAVNGIEGGNSLVGAISKSGAFSPSRALAAPAILTITATSLASGATGNATVTFVYTAPTIRAVDRPTIQTGGMTLRVTGQYFQSDAKASLGGIPLGVTYMTPGMIEVTGNLPSQLIGRQPLVVANPGPPDRASLPFTIDVREGAAGTLTIAPAGISVRAASVQVFTAQVEGLSNPAVSWTVNGIAGGNTTIGRVDASGRYTAPDTLPDPPSVRIGAASVQNPNTRAELTVPLLNPLAIVTSVSPSILEEGPFSLVVRGAHFVPGAEVRLGTQTLATTYVSRSELRASGIASMAEGSPLPIVVFNPEPGSAPSSALLVAVQEPPPPVGGALTLAEIGHFLEQATFGPTPAAIERVRRLGFEGWIDEQFALPESQYFEPAENKADLVARQFFHHTLEAEDQLRQRAVFALGQIIVVSTNKLDGYPAILGWQRLLSQHAFGNYRELLEAVTISPAMGRYLDLANSSRPDGRNAPNENYPRELLQLFSIGLEELNPDGTPRLGPGAEPIGSYTQEDVVQLSLALTGWGFATAPGEPVRWPTAEYYGAPMEAWEDRHDRSEKTLLGWTIPAGGTTELDTGIALDAIFHHPNVGPFVGLRLIQHFVTSNPSPAYVARVAAAFDDNGRGVRGDLRAVIKATLLDPEARRTTARPDDGHLREPALFVAGVLRGLGASVAPDYDLQGDLRSMGQELLKPPSVFNYYSPFYRVRGTDLGGPEFQILSPPQLVARHNFVYKLLTARYGANVLVDLGPWNAVAGDPAQLVAEVDRVFFFGAMPAPMRQVLLDALAAHGTNLTSRSTTALLVALTAGEYQVEH